MAPTLSLLVGVAEAPKVSQRGLAGRMGVALGLANAYLKRAVGKGWIKMRQAPARRFLYYLTPEGFAEKAALTRDYLSDSLRFFRRARQQSTDLLLDARKRGHKRIVLAGCGELAEIVSLSAQELGIEILGILDARRNVESFAAIPVFHDLSALQQAGLTADAVLITDIDDPQACFDRLQAALSPDRLLVMPLLHVVPRRQESDTDAEAGEEEADAEAAA
ncbi:MarR family transcriptional regulator [Ferrovibrio sp.]|uniref:MarR family transcriptional regulator n=1 Tax=Ferrovibrio sp. TaxID=1917215 RepID=UPI0025C6CF77|nr:MarR family transcriptional regulator [Ferrovibrio sp.]MBX3454611.1 MarR family transcriptional regulator [Ferrovibrio sp.]